MYDASFNTDSWTKLDERLSPAAFLSLSSNWSWSTPLRNDYARRQALVELDVLVARELALSLDELKTIWRVQFPVARQYELDTWYDANGRIVFTVSRGLTSVGLSRGDWELVKHRSSGETVSHTIIDNTRPGGPRERTITYVAPFDRCDREADYDTAWTAFERRRNSASVEAAQ
jgi:hypothetical protein